jgi:DnaJ-class molecular chaperone
VQVVVRVPTKMKKEEEDLIRQLAGIQGAKVEHKSFFKQVWDDLTR